MEESVGKDLQQKRSVDDALSQSHNLMIDISSSSTLTDDRSSGPGNETSFDQLGTIDLDADKAVDMAPTSEQIEQMPKLLETPEPQKTGKNGKFNLRKSLAWDSAFFTSDGVLDAEELSTMIEGGEKGVKHQLPGIEEEVYRSMESISTLESDNLTLESLETELFEDIRASIQKSNRASNLNNSSIKVSSGKKDSQSKVSSSSKKVDPDSGKRPAAKIKDQTSLIPQPKMISRVKSISTLTTKRASLSANPPKKDQDIVKQAHVIQRGAQATKTTTQGSKITGVIGPRRGVPKPSLNSTSSSLTSATAVKKEPSRPSSSCGSSGSSSGNDVKSSTTFSRRKTDPKTAKPTAGPTPKTPSRISIKNKAPPANSRLSSRLVLSNLSSSISPASSISEWSSESSSSTSTTNRKSVSRAADSNRSLDGDSAFDVSDLNIRPTGRNSNHNGNHPGSVSVSQSGSLARPPTVQPTGLRMPSPKIGFFDGGKSGVRTPNGTIRSQVRLPTGVPKPGPTNCSPTNSNGVKYGKLLPPKTTTATHTNIKPNPQKTTPKPSQEQPITKPKTPGASKGVKSGLVTSTVSDHKSEIKIVSADESSESEPGLNICKKTDSNKESHLGNGTSGKIDTVGTTSDVLDSKGEIKIFSADEGSESESSLNICKKTDSNKESHLGNGTSGKIDTVETAFDVSDREGEIKIVSADEGSESESSLNICKKMDSNKESHLGNGTSSKIDTLGTTFDVSDHKSEIKIVSAGEGSESESSLKICKKTDSSEESHLSNGTSSKIDTVETTFDVSDREGEIKTVSADEGSESESILNICMKTDSNKESHLGIRSSGKIDTVDTTFDVSDHKGEIKIVSADEGSESESSLNICMKTDSNQESHLGNGTLSKSDTVGTTFDVSDHKSEIKIVSAGEGSESESSLKICEETDSNKESDLGNGTSGKIDTVGTTFDVSDCKGEIKIVSADEVSESESSLKICKKSDSSEESHLGNGTSSKIDIVETTFDVSDREGEIKIVSADEGSESESILNICMKTDSNKESHLGNRSLGKIDTVETTFDVSDHKGDIKIVSAGEGSESESSLNICMKTDSNQEYHLGNGTLSKIDTVGTTFDVSDHKSKIKIVSAGEGSESESSLKICEETDLNKESDLGNGTSGKFDTVGTTFDVSDCKGEIKIVSADEVSESESSLKICKKIDSSEESHLGNGTSSKIDIVETTFDVSDRDGEINIVSADEGSESESILNICMKTDSNKESHLGNRSSGKIDTVGTTFDVSDRKGEIKTVSADEGSESEPSLKKNESNKESHLGNETSSKIDTVDIAKSASGVRCNEGFVAIKDGKVITDGPRIPFAEKNCDSNETGMEVTEKTVKFPFMESQHKENSEVI